MHARAEFIVEIVFLPVFHECFHFFRIYFSFTVIIITNILKEVHRVVSEEVREYFLFVAITQFNFLESLKLQLTICLICDLC